MTAISSHIIAACWYIFVFAWIISATRTKRIAERQSLQSALAHRIPIALGWWTLAFPEWKPPMSWQILPRTFFSQLIGAAICAGGLVFTLWARWTLAGNWSSDITFKQDHELIRTGPYHIVRHPIYTGLLVMIFGTAIYLSQLRGVLSLLATSLGFWIKLRQEERLLVRHFPETYPTYQREVKALVPFLI